MGLRALIDEPGLDQGVGDERLQILRGAHLHARRDLFGKQFEQQFGHFRLSNRALPLPAFRERS